MRPSQAALIWGDENATSTALLAVGVVAFGRDCVHWAPDTWVREVDDEAEVALSDGNLDRVMAACSLVRYPEQFYNDHQAFELLCRMFSSDGPHARPKYGELALSPDVVWGCLEAALIHPVDQDTPWGLDVKTYVKVALEHDGITRVPAALKAVGLKDLKVSPGYDYTEDPELFQADQAGREAAAEDVDQFVRYKLGLVHEQLSRVAHAHEGLSRMAKVVGKLVGAP